jgi:hypothetical protein
MSRPETLDDVTDRRTQLAVFHFDQLATDPHLLRSYAAFVERAQDLGGETDLSYSTVTVYRPKVEKELTDQLKADQATWDNHHKLYERLVAGEEFRHDYERNVALKHAADEGLPVPDESVVAE